MSRSSNFKRVLCGIACMLLFTACSTMPVAKRSSPSIADMMAKASAALNAGQKEAALEIWKQTAAAFPADKEPWLRIAQTRYDAGQYGDAIMNAQEVLVRDPSDKLANSIVAISGLRLATRALSDLSLQNNLSGSLRTESQDLAKLLRDSLGETVLVPAKAAPPVNATPPVNAMPPVKAAQKTTRRPASRANNNRSANPLQGLK